VHKKNGEKQKAINTLMEGVATFQKLGNQSLSEEFQRRVSRYSAYVQDRSVFELTKDM